MKQQKMQHADAASTPMRMSKIQRMQNFAHGVRQYSQRRALVSMCQAIRCGHMGLPFGTQRQASKSRFRYNGHLRGSQLAAIGPCAQICSRGKLWKLGLDHLLLLAKSKPPPPPPPLSSRLVSPSHLPLVCSWLVSRAREIYKFTCNNTHHIFFNKHLVWLNKHMGGNWHQIEGHLILLSWQIII